MNPFQHRYAKIFFLGLGHGLNDFIAGYFLGSLVQLKIDLLQIGLGLFIYNLLAFGGQYPVALLLEKHNQPKTFLLAAYALNVIAIAIFFISPQLSIVLAGIASALYHVTGGTICAEKNRATNIGLFAAPGVAGLIAGGYFAYLHIDLEIWLLATAAVFLFLFFILPVKLPDKTAAKPNSDKPTVFDGHDIVMILLLIFISFRSVIWNIFRLIHENDYHWLIAIAAAAFFGKIIGGWLADRIGWRMYSIISLAIATPLLTFFRNELLLFTIGIGLLQSSIPATTSLLIRSMAGKTERAIALSFGTTILAGTILFYTAVREFFLSNLFLGIIAFIMIVLLFIMKKINKA